MRIIEKVIYKGKSTALEDLKNDYYTYNVPGAKWKFSKIFTEITNMAALPGEQAQFKSYLVGEFDKIIKASPDELQSYVQYIVNNHPNLLYKDDKSTPFGKSVEGVFNYAGFRSSSKAKWYATVLGVRTCLYCNCQFTLEVTKKSSSGLLFQFDHFYSKSRYPHLSLSMYNLIPSCSNCNTAKSKKEFSIENAVHPYKEDMNKLLKFQVSNADVLEYLINKSPQTISIILDHKSLKVQKHIDTFSLEQVYNQYKDYIEELMLKAYYYDESTRRELRGLFDDIIDENTIKRFILGNYYLDEDLNNRPLAKMTKDVAIQIGLIT